MTQQHGLFTVQTWITLTPDLRARLERLVREEGGDLADTLSRIVAASPLDAAGSETPPAGDPLPVRVFVTPEQRAAIERTLAERDTSLPALLSQVVAARLATLPAVRAAAARPGRRAQAPQRAGAAACPPRRRRRCRARVAARLHRRARGRAELPAVAGGPGRAVPSLKTYSSPAFILQSYVIRKVRAGFGGAAPKKNPFSTFQIHEDCYRKHATQWQETRSASTSS
jgi:hypothetical protein